ncbi:MAG TPA: nuclear transport factor 2 family protein [Actinomycetes bacterium]|nr:nuclear transport factor 2 family protein [Actinomycetes bacterium]
MCDDDRVASLFTQDGAVRIPDINAEAVSREQIRAGVERLHAASLRNGRWRGTRALGGREGEAIARCRWVAVRWRHEAPRRSRGGSVPALRDHR